uniref:Uncharacterized protein n=1 Tax=Anguilla anguilla TaxID=7936 RepID=A0A0E9V7Y7_ANGAN
MRSDFGGICRAQRSLTARQ